MNMNTAPMLTSTPHQYVRSIPRDIVLTLLTCGLWNFRVQHQQMEAVNVMIREERYKFLPWFLLTFVTCGLYHIYHEYRMSADISTALQKKDNNEAIACLVLTVLGLGFVADAIQQSEINKFFGSNAL